MVQTAGIGPLSVQMRVVQKILLKGVSAMSKPVSNTEWLRLKQGSEYSGFSERSLRYWISDGKLPAYKSPGGTIMIKRSDLDAAFDRIPAVSR
jgi:excisionase family DNA binding protein